jgi:hypothetical protein
LIQEFGIFSDHFSWDGRYLMLGMTKEPAVGVNGEPVRLLDGANLLGASALDVLSWARHGRFVSIALDAKQSAVGQIIGTCAQTAAWNRCRRIVISRSYLFFTSVIPFPAFGMSSATR